MAKKRTNVSLFHCTLSRIVSYILPQSVLHRRCWKGSARCSMFNRHRAVTPGSHRLCRRKEPERVRHVSFYALSGHAVPALSVHAVCKAGSRMSGVRKSAYCLAICGSSKYPRRPIFWSRNFWVRSVIMSSVQSALMARCDS